MKLVVFLALIGLASVSAAQPWAKEMLAASPRHQEWVEVENGSRTVKCFVVYPERKTKAPVVVLIHEIFGLSDWAQAEADEWAATGFIAIAPDLLSGMGPNGGRTDSFTDQSKITEAVSGLPPDQVTGDLNAAADYAKKLPSANGRLVVAGFCWGGSQSFRFATNRADLSAAFVFYGTAPKEADAIARIGCPVYGFYGGNDNRVNATIADTEKAMKEANKRYEPVIYDGAGHGFMRAGEQPGASEANKKARDAAWVRIREITNRLKL